MNIDNIRNMKRNDVIMRERVKRLRQESLSAIPRISMERAKIVEEVYKKYYGKKENLHK